MQPLNVETATGHFLRSTEMNHASPAVAICSSPVSPVLTSPPSHLPPDSASMALLLSDAVEKLDLTSTPPTKPVSLKVLLLD